MRKKLLKNTKHTSKGKLPITLLFIGITLSFVFVIQVLFYFHHVTQLAFVSETPPCANSISCAKDLTGQFEPNTQGTYMGKQITSPPLLANGDNPIGQAVLGQNTGGNKHIYVD